MKKYAHALPLSLSPLLHHHHHYHHHYPPLLAKPNLKPPGSFHRGKEKGENKTYKRVLSIYLSVYGNFFFPLGVFSCLRLRLIYHTYDYIHEDEDVRRYRFDLLRAKRVLGFPLVSTFIFGQVADEYHIYNIVRFFFYFHLVYHLSIYVSIYLSVCSSSRHISHLQGVFFSSTFLLFTFYFLLFTSVSFFLSHSHVYFQSHPWNGSTRMYRPTFFFFILFVMSRILLLH